MELFYCPSAQNARVLAVATRASGLKRYGCPRPIVHRVRVICLALLSLAVVANTGCGGDEEAATTTVNVTTTSPAATETSDTTTAEPEPAEPAESAASFAKSVTEANLKGQYGKNWARLHPAHKDETSRSEWEACQEKAADGRAGIKVLSIDVLETYVDEYEAPKLGPVEATAVTMRLRYTHPLFEGEQELTDTIYIVDVDGEWRGLWDQATFDAYQAGRCPD